MIGATAADLVCAIRDCSVDMMVIKHRAAQVTSGRVTGKSPKDSVAFTGSFQPLTERELRHLPEGARHEGRAKIYTDFELDTASTSAGNVADLVVYQGVTYQVEKVNPWVDLGGYYKVEVVRVNR